MKKHHWHLILEPNMSAPKTGVYLFAIRNDNHICDYQTDGLRMLAFTLKGVLQYAFTEESCVSLERGCLIYSGDYLFSTDCYTDSAEEDDIRQDTRLIAYHYVEFFGEKGHSYWWNEYRKKQSNIQLHVQDSLFTG